MITLVDQSDPQDVKKKRESGLEHICSHNPLCLPVIKRRLAEWKARWEATATHPSGLQPSTLLWQERWLRLVVKWNFFLSYYHYYYFTIIITLWLLLTARFSFGIAIKCWLKCLEMVLRWCEMFVFVKWTWVVKISLCLKVLSRSRRLLCKLGCLEYATEYKSHVWQWKMAYIKWKK